MMSELDSIRELAQQLSEPFTRLDHLPILSNVGILGMTQNLGILRENHVCLCHSNLYSYFKHCIKQQKKLINTEVEAVQRILSSREESAMRIPQNAAVMANMSGLSIRTISNQNLK